MHIPSADTTALAVLPFEQALAQALLPQKDYRSDAWLYVPPYYDEYRYILGTRGKRPLICIGINPSTASPDHLDNTLKSVERIAHFNGFDSFMMFNLYPQRATNPDDMEKSRNDSLHAENMKAFSYALDLYADQDAPAVWAAWGAIIEKRRYLFDCVGDMVRCGTNRGARWFTAGKRSKAGHPHHPLYLPKNSVLEAFDPLPYINSFLTPTI